MSRVALVVAVARNGVIGKDGGLPWHISSDLQRFKAITMGKPVIMGRKTWESLPKKPLAGRTNIVVTRDPALKAEGALIAADAAAALKLAAAEAPDEIAVIGGGEIYRMFLPLAQRIYLTEIELEVAGDTVFPALEAGEWREVGREVHARGPRDTAGFTLRILDRAGA
ncbi:MAG: dihydrofolate reductase [Rhizobiales bacterium]|nr:dihydrofolate reductase [Hyphomicrobiales bacterium]MBI3673980.1 dihydrofolate reductase [Hyphomicrobiales bacterium]